MADLETADLEYNLWKFNNLKQTYFIYQKQIKNIETELSEKSDLSETEIKNLKQLIKDLQNVCTILTNGFPSFNHLQ